MAGTQSSHTLCAGCDRVLEERSDQVLQDRLGHASITTTLDAYGHLMTGLDEAAPEALDSIRREGPSMTLER